MEMMREEGDYHHQNWQTQEMPTQAGDEMSPQNCRATVRLFQGCLLKKHI